MSGQLTIQEMANWFLSKEAMTHKKLQKLCYYGVAWGYALTNDSIVSNDEFQAWIHGPVSPTLYRTYKESGWNLLAPYKGKLKTMGSNVAELLEAVWATYGDKGGNELEALSHSERPWVEARGTLAADVASTNKIDPEIMKTFYRGIKSTEY